MIADQLDDGQRDKKADELIQACLNLDTPQSFFLYAGAGSGKTRSLVDAINHVLLTPTGRRLALARQKVGVITYTNAACDEIASRLKYDARVEVATIHAFAWSMISGYNDDIRIWVKGNLESRIAELEEEIAGARNQATKTYQDRVRSLASKRRRLAALPGVKKFIYSPIGDNRTRDALNHSEVISITSEFLTNKPVLQLLLTSRYPFLLVDESQDTNRHLMDALLTVQVAHTPTFALGLLGDTMQRIYADGKVDLGKNLPGWAFPQKAMNHRCPHRVIRLINRIRADADGLVQAGRRDKPEGFVRLFALPISVPDKMAAEGLIAKEMSEVTGDPAWASACRDFKTLTLEHHMAAVRFGFAQMFEPIYSEDRLQTSLLQGTSAPLRFFSKEVLPLVRALRGEDDFTVAAVVRKFSPLLDPAVLKATPEKQMEQLARASEAARSLKAIVDSAQNPTFRDVLQNVARTGLFAVPDALLPFAQPDDPDVVDQEPSEGATSEAFDTSETAAWRTMLATPFDQIEAYDQYVSGRSPFGTHQGVKGLEFPRVMVVISDDEARGFLFKYDKLFGVEPKSATDLKREASGEETSIDRTRRLFYVTCSRAEESLAIVCYTSNPQGLVNTVVSRGWFDGTEASVVTL
ncbi:UvrD-helicase domain-containing protein [Mesorhizobium ciceri]|uniref:UvrD-helicase domain-containing protein n=1 Tax=Mesorhizobium TaxID=68287 RepID=UPI00047D1193|nr:UvrD-helicase domain-containing protein [Mesorhizobium ciceri]